MTGRYGKRVLWVIERRERRYYPRKPRSRWGKWSAWAPYVFHEGGNIGQPLTRIRAHELVGYWSPKLDEQFRVVRYTP